MPEVELSSAVSLSKLSLLISKGLVNTLHIHVSRGAIAENLKIKVPLVLGFVNPSR